MQPCSSPPSVTNGFFVIAKGSYSNGDQISYYCKMGYELTGTATRSCDGATGAWSGSTPKCTAATTIASVTTTTESPSQITGRFCCYFFGGFFGVFFLYCFTFILYYLFMQGLFGVCTETEESHQEIVYINVQ